MRGRTKRAAHRELAVFQSQRAPHAPRQPFIMRRDDQGHIELAIKFMKQLMDLIRGMRVEIAGRLVRQHQARALHHRPRDRDALLLAAG